MPDRARTVHMTGYRADSEGDRRAKRREGEVTRK